MEGIVNKIFEIIIAKTESKDNSTTKILLDDNNGFIRMLIIHNNLNSSIELDIESGYMSLIYQMIYEKLKENKAQNKLDIDKGYNIASDVDYLRVMYKLPHHNTVDVILLSNSNTHSIINEIVSDWKCEIMQKGK